MRWKTELAVPSTSMAGNLLEPPEERFQTSCPTHHQVELDLSSLSQNSSLHAGSRAAGVPKEARQ